MALQDALARRVVLIASNTLRDLANVPGVDTPTLVSAVERMAQEAQRVFCLTTEASRPVPTIGTTPPREG